MIAKLDRYIAASAYFFELGYFFSFLLNLQKTSAFVRFHFKQVNHFIVFLILPSLALLGLGVYTNVAVFGYLSILFFIGYLVVSLIAAIYALHGQMKKIF